MKIKSILDEDFINYKRPAMYIAFPFCSFKCEHECGIACCQNSKLAMDPIVEYSTDDLIKRYLRNPITKAVVCCGLEPFDSFVDLLELITKIRVDYKCDDDIVIYTGYNKDEIPDKIEIIKKFKNLIVKFGRYIPDQENKFDQVLGVKLASPNQYAEKIS